MASRSDRPAPAGTVRRGGGRRSVGSYLVLGAFAALLLALVLAWSLPPWVPAVYLAVSLVTAVVYAVDKSAARGGRRRISERTLLTLGLLCGWPGAILAQQLLRHKTTKASFRSSFSLTVVANILALVVLASPWFAGVLRDGGPG
jgi:uncharacterized membrane protein YsdA (DUF1294 family)